MTLALAALILFASAMPVDAKTGRYSSRSGWAEEEKCYRTEYSEEYVPEPVISWTCEDMTRESSYSL